MKKKWSNLLIVLLFLVGIGVLAYPTVSNQWNTYQQNKLIASYQVELKELTPEYISDAWVKARAFNDSFQENTLDTEVFGETETDMKETEYWKVLNPAGDGVMGYISIPKINVSLSIYHGTDETDLQTGVGHINGTKLPIGGESNHSVLAGHRGLPSARLFTDIDQMVVGDKFYIHIMDEVFAYEVDQILDMIDKDDVKALGDALKIEEGKDQVTLFTCTPYGINSHRLLVRGIRVPYNGEDDPIDNVGDAMLKSIKDYYILYLVLALAIVAVAVMIMKKVFDKKKKLNS